MRFVHGLFGAAALGAALCWGAACSDDPVPDTSGAGGAAAIACDATLQGAQAVFAARCVDGQCHGAADTAGGLDLESADVEARLIEVGAATCDRTLVVPGDAALSFLFQKIGGGTTDCGFPMPPTGALPASEVACIEGWINAMPEGCETCGGSGCADLDTDPNRCGACDNVCPSGATCVQGSCACGANEMTCGDTCADVQSNPSHCSACNTPCSAGEVCSAGACKSGCDAGLTECDGACVDFDSDPNHCGGCDQDCGTGTCESGACFCGPGIDPQTDPQNCGACGNACTPGQACENGVCGCGTATVSFSEDVEPILTQNCATTGCHRLPAPKESLILTAGDAYFAMVGVPAQQCGDGRDLVSSGDPAASYLMDKLLGTNMCFGSRMPKQTSLSDAEIATISNWICIGAPNN